MKKKMTNAEFEEWGRYAIELREKAVAGEIEFAEYYLHYKPQRISTNRKCGLQKAALVFLRERLFTSTSGVITAFFWCYGHSVLWYA